MTDYITAAALFCLALYGVYLVHRDAAIAILKQPLPPERYQMDDDTLPVRFREGGE